MTVDCQWVEKSLEALCCDGLNEEQSRAARAHIDNCTACQKEMQALNAIDPLVRKHFQRELEIARRPRVADTRRVFGLGGAALAMVAILLFVVLRPSATSPTILPAAAPTAAAPIVAVEPPAPIKNDAAETTARTKPSAQPAPLDQRTVAPPSVSASSPDFLVTDPAGYSHTLDDYRKHVAVIAVWNPDQPAATANFERLYKTYGANPKFRFLGVSDQGQPRPANTTFQVVYNQGSKMFGAQPGEFVLLNENGAVELRGSLVKDFENLQKALQGK